MYPYVFGSVFKGAVWKAWLSGIIDNCSTYRIVGWSLSGFHELCKHVLVAGWKPVGWPARIRAGNWPPKSLESKDLTSSQKCDWWYSYLISWAIWPCWRPGYWKADPAMELSVNSLRHLRAQPSHTLCPSIAQWFAGKTFYSMTTPFIFSTW